MPATRLLRYAHHPFDSAIPSHETCVDLHGLTRPAQRKASRMTGISAQT